MFSHLAYVVNLSFSVFKLKELRGTTTAKLRQLNRS